ncbi:PIN domain-containing protein [Vineibacter terrae]|uniref:PIN domain-containing protein n=1 Tax=Vineibacter terrae TaxID=2586908 RepID=UPI002E37E511|nr:PIN domain-containing protein [Vineibacter terrae]HEX2887312.1 PIN domain-containing protein [Vineibacter terrae]
MTERRHVKLFRNGRNQAVRIPMDFELPGNEAIMHRDGDIPADAEYAATRSALESIGSNDLLIAAHARATGATIVTANTGEFKRGRGLKVENWLV